MLSRKAKHLAIVTGDSSPSVLHMESQGQNDILSLVYSGQIFIFSPYNEKRSP